MKDFIVVEEFTTFTHDDGKKTYHSKLEGREKETKELCFAAECEGNDSKAVRKAGRLGLVHSLEKFWGVSEEVPEVTVAAPPA